jgi:hypothetical protein
VQFLAAVSARASDAAQATASEKKTRLKRRRCRRHVFAPLVKLEYIVLSSAGQAWTDEFF